MSVVLVTGVAVLDFIFHMSDFPRAAEKYRADGATISGGGNAANAAVAIARLQGEPHLAARLGDDEIADLIIGGLKSEGVNIGLTHRFTSHRSSFSSVYVDGAGERQIMNYRDKTLPEDAGWLASTLPQNIDAALADTRWPHGALIAMEAARTRGVAGVLDVEMTVTGAEEALNAASHVAFSAKGVRDYSTESDLEKAAVIADERLPGTVMVTDGPRGTMIILDGKAQWHGAFKIKPVDTLGAGDVWHGALALADGENQNDAIVFANAAAAIKCTRRGGRDGTPTRVEVVQFLEEN